MTSTRRMSRGLTLALVLCALAASPFGADNAQAQGTHTVNWDRKMPAATRFVVLSAFGNAAVRDNETGLVWDRNPLSVPLALWRNGGWACVHSTRGGRMGWRLPSIPELTSLIDPAQASFGPGLSLPPGHPFINIQQSGLGATYWSATSYAGNASFAYAVDFDFGLVETPTKDEPLRLWCVRGSTQESVH